MAERSTHGNAPRGTPAAEHAPADAKDADTILEGRLEEAEKRAKEAEERTKKLEKELERQAEEHKKAEERTKKAEERTKKLEKETEEYKKKVEQLLKEMQASSALKDVVRGAAIDTAPSNLSVTAVAQMCDEVSVGATPSFLEVVEDLYGPDRDSLAERAKGLTDGLCKVRWGDSKPSVLGSDHENSTSAFIAAHLRHHLGWEVSEQTPLSYLRSGCEQPTAATAHLDLAVWATSEAERGKVDNVESLRDLVVPALLEVGGSSKAAQCFGYGLALVQQNALALARRSHSKEEEEAPASHQAPVLALAVLMDKRSLELWGYCPLIGGNQDSDSDKALGRSLLFRGDLEQQLPRALFAIQRFVQRPRLKEHIPWRATRRTIVAVEVPEEGTFMYKAFDYRYRSPSLQYKDKRRHQLNLVYIPDAELVVDAEDLVVIRYPRLVGSHVPSTVGEFAAVVEQLKDLHSENVCHGDIRLANIVFHSKRSRLIDFDWAGRVDDKEVYPSGYNRAIEDGTRHEEAQPGKELSLKHDCFSLAACMQLFEAESFAADKWKHASQLVKERDLAEALEELKDIHSIALTHKNEVTPTLLHAHQPGSRTNKQ